MNLRGERVLIFGDSLTHHGAMDAPEIWDVTLGANRSSGAPGDLLASLVRDQGAAAVRINANVGRSAKNFWTAPNRRQTHPASFLLDADRAWRPTKVIIMLGTNDADIGAMDPGSITRLRDTYAAMGAEVIAIGPPVFADARLTANAAKVYGVLGAVFPGKVIDARPLSSTTGRAGDGVHFTATGARAFALKLLPAVQGIGTNAGAGSGSAPPTDAGGPPSPGAPRSGVLPALLTFAGLLGVGVLGVRWWRQRSAPLKGARDSEGFKARMAEFKRRAAERKQQNMDLAAQLERHGAVFLVTPHRRILAIKSAEMSNPEEGRLRVSLFDEDGPFSHITRDDLSVIADELATWRATEVQPAGDADVLAFTSTARFAEGAAHVAEMQRRNRR